MVAMVDVYESLVLYYKVVIYLNMNFMLLYANGKLMHLVAHLTSKQTWSYKYCVWLFVVIPFINRLVFINEQTSDDV